MSPSLALDQIAELLELRRASRGAPFEYHGFGGGDDRSAGGQAAESDFPVEFGSAGDRVGGDEDLIAARQVALGYSKGITSSPGTRENSETLAVSTA